MIIKNNTTNEILIVNDLRGIGETVIGITLQPQASLQVYDVEASKSKDLKAFIDSAKIIITSQAEAGVVGGATDDQSIADASGAVGIHNALATGVHGVGASTVESASGSQGKVNTHNGLNTGVHGVAGSQVESIAGSQAKVDTHNNLTTGIHNNNKIVDYIISRDALIQFLPTSAGDNPYNGVHGTPVTVEVGVTDSAGILNIFDNTSTVVVTITGGTATAPVINGGAGPITVTMVNGKISFTIDASTLGTVLLGLSGGNRAGLDKTDTATVSLT